jgi:predicted ribosome quality control (RQC) complex YloA/Tae2 family protein
MEQLDEDALTLDALGKLLWAAIDECDKAEDEWEQLRDRVQEELKREMDEDGRKGDPAEHTIIAVARRRDRDLYRRFRSAKREKERCQALIDAKGKAISARQSWLKGEGTQAGAKDFGTGASPIVGRRAA